MKPWQLELELRGHRVFSVRCPISVHYKWHEVGQSRLDFLVEECCCKKRLKGRGPMGAVHRAHASPYLSRPGAGLDASSIPTCRGSGSALCASFCIIPYPSIALCVFVTLWFNLRVVLHRPNAPAEAEDSARRSAPRRRGCCKTLMVLDAEQAGKLASRGRPADTSSRVISAMRGWRRPMMPASASSSRVNQLNGQGAPSVETARTSGRARGHRPPRPPPGVYCSCRRATSSDAGSSASSISFAPRPVSFGRARMESAKRVLRLQPRRPGRSTPAALILSGRHQPAAWVARIHLWVLRPQVHPPQVVGNPAGPAFTSSAEAPRIDVHRPPRPPSAAALTR